MNANGMDPVSPAVSGRVESATNPSHRRRLTGRARSTSSDTILIAAVTLWALNYSVMKYGITQIAPLALPVIRFGTAGLILLAILQRHEGSVSVRRQDIPRLIVAGFFGITLSQLSFVYALTYTTASDNALLGATAPMVTVVIATIVGLERSTTRHWLAVLIGLLGVVLIVVGGPAAVLFQSGLLGDALAFGNVLVSSIAAILIVPLLPRYSVYRILTYEMLIGTLVLLPLALPSILAQDYGRVTLGGWAALGYAIVLTGLVTNLLYYTAVRRIGASRAAVYQYLQAFLGVLFAVLLLREQVTLVQLVGGAIVVGSVVLSRSSRRPIEVPADEGRSGTDPLALDPGRASVR
jgi:drug/metabolite transporter (DMT)-like permease